MKMAKRFTFDDDDDFFNDDSENENESSNDTSLITVPEDSVDEEEDMTKKKKFKVKPWMVILGVLFIIVFAFVIYIFVLTNTDGPVYGDRCEGAYEISEDAITTTIETIKEEYDSITDLTIEIACKEVKIDIEFEAGMDTDDAKKIGRETAHLLDDTVGIEKEDEDDKWSNLYGYISNVAQYDVQLYLTSEDSEDFPIYATKHHSGDNFSYTYASVKDEESKEKAEATLEDDEETTESDDDSE